MSNISNQSLYSSANSSTATLRPRNTRLISYGDNEGTPTNGSPNLTSVSNPTQGGTRFSSPLQSTSGTSSPTRAIKNSQLRSTSEHGDRRPSSGLWDSWSQIQGIASTILRSDAAGVGIRKGSISRNPLWPRQDHAYSITQSAKSWGPKTEPTLGAGPSPIEERNALVQAKKREALLVSASEESRDVTRRFKRKVSNASISIGPLTDDSIEDALVYRHKVQANDTLAGVTIKYSCQPEIFRKINRFWPNDKIQTRKQVLLPVEACSIRGRKVDAPDSVDLLGEELSQSEVEVDHSSALLNGAPGPLSTPVSTSNVSTKPDPERGDYRHDSWVQLPSFSQPTEILRISRKTLGYFPPARRKSNHSLFQDSVTSSPRTSFDTLRHPPSHAAQQAQLHQQHPTSMSLNASPVRRPRLATVTSRQRSSSTVSTTSTAAQSHFVSALRGPGGVGTLRGLRTEIARPGPSEDPLNQRFAKYLPDVAPVSSDDSDLLAPPLGPGIGSRTFSSLALPRASTDSIRSTRSGRSNSSTSAAFGGGVETWMKNLKISRPAVNRTNSDRPANNMMIGGETGLGDLIELEGSIDTVPTDPALQQQEPKDSPGRGRLVYDLNSGVSAGSKSTTSSSTNNNNDPFVRDSSDLLNERFPVRGRITRAYGQE